MTTPVAGPEPTDPTLSWTSPAKQDAMRAAEINNALPLVQGVAAVHPPATPVEQLGPAGIRVHDDRVEVHIVAEYGTPLHHTAKNIEAAVRPLLGGRNLEVVIDDILLPGESLASVVQLRPDDGPENEIEPNSGKPVV